MTGKNNDELIQDWFTDSHETFEQTFKTMTELYDEEFRLCTTCEQRPVVQLFLRRREQQQKRMA